MDRIFEPGGFSALAISKALEVCDVCVEVCQWMCGGVSMDVWRCVECVNGCVEVWQWMCGGAWGVNGCVEVCGVCQWIGEGVGCEWRCMVEVWKLMYTWVKLSVCG